MKILVEQINKDEYNVFEQRGIYKSAKYWVMSGTFSEVLEYIESKKGSVSVRWIYDHA